MADKGRDEATKAAATAQELLGAAQKMMAANLQSSRQIHEAALQTLRAENARLCSELAAVRATRVAEQRLGGELSGWHSARRSSASALEESSEEELTAFDASAARARGLGASRSAPSIVRVAAKGPARHAS